MRILTALLFSLVLHALITWTFSLVPDQWAEQNQAQKNLQKSTVEVQLIPKPKDDSDQQVVRDTQIPEAQKSNLKDPARFLSAKTQRVWVETRARKIGLTENRVLNKLKVQAEEKAKVEKSVDKDDEFSFYKPVDFQRALHDNQDEGYSTTGEALPEDLALGDFNALNTDQYQFYSFYSRVEELVRFRWETRVKNAIEIYDRKNLLQRIGNKNWISKMTFFLSPDGRLQKVQVTQESGVQAFDQAAIGAFQEALIFPNPPQEMVKSDGYIHLQYSFNVHFNPQSLAF